MDGPVLSWRERQILAAIENDLRAADGKLDHALSTMRPGLSGRVRDAVHGAVRAVGQVPVGVLVFLVALSLGLLLASPLAPGVGVLAFFGTVWLSTLVLLGTRLGRRWHRRAR